MAAARPDGLEPAVRGVPVYPQARACTGWPRPWRRGIVVGPRVRVVQLGPGRSLDGPARAWRMRSGLDAIRRHGDRVPAQRPSRAAASRARPRTLDRTRETSPCGCPEPAESCSTRPRCRAGSASATSARRPRLRRLPGRDRPALVADAPARPDRLRQLALSVALVVRRQRAPDQPRAAGRGRLARRRRTWHDYPALPDDRVDFDAVAAAKDAPLPPRLRAVPARPTLELRGVPREPAPAGSTTTPCTWP